MMFARFQLNRFVVLALSFVSIAVPYGMADEGYPVKQERLASDSSAVGSLPDKADQSALQEKASPKTSLLREKEIKTSIEAWHGRVQTKVARIEELALTLDLKKIQSQSLVAGELKELLGDLDSEASEIIEAYEALGPDLELYRKALEAAPASFMRISADLEKSAIQTRSPLLQQTYADFAMQSRKLASHYGEQAKGIGELGSEVEQKIGFVRESRKFFSEVRMLLDAIPADSGFATEKLVERMNQYIDVFQSAMKAMQGVGDKIVAKKDAASEGNKLLAPTTSTKPSAPQDPFAAIGRRK